MIITCCHRCSRLTTLFRFQCCWFSSISGWNVIFYINQISVSLNRKFMWFGYFNIINICSLCQGIQFSWIVISKFPLLCGICVLWECVYIVLVLERILVFFFPFFQEILWDMFMVVIREVVVSTTLVFSLSACIFLWLLLVCIEIRQTEPCEGAGWTFSISKFSGTNVSLDCQPIFRMSC